MRTIPITVSAPGSILLTGEHAVIHGYPAIVAAIDQRVTVTITPLADPVLTVVSEIAEPQTAPLVTLKPEGPYRFVNAAVLRFMSSLEAGLRIEITSEINPTLGLGSSAAVTIAVLAGLAGRVDGELHTNALNIIRTCLLYTSPSPRD